MYSTCLYCHSSLGTNEVIEHFPVGRRLAFDAAKGRLWVVCRKCERWNLTPIEERWEAIDECERLFRDTKLRVSTDNIGLGRVREGLELVRIGEPRRPEMAAWRYGDQFGRRQRRHYMWGGAIVAGVGSVYLLGPALGLYAFGSVGAMATVGNLAIQGFRLVHGRAMRVKLALAGSPEPVILNRLSLEHTTLLRTNNELGWVLILPLGQVVETTGKGGQPIRAGAMQFEGDEAMRVAGQLLPKLNVAGARKSEVEDAVELLERKGRPHDVFGYAAGRQSQDMQASAGVRLGSLPKPIRLALEMAAHEDTEHRALEGELAMLETQWKDAEEIAAISDNMFLPPGVDAWIKKQKLEE